LKLKCTATSSKKGLNVIHSRKGENMVKVSALIFSMNRVGNVINLASKLKDYVDEITTAKETLKTYLWVYHYGA